MDSGTIARVWAGSWSEYTEGRLVGDWLDLPMDPAELVARLREISPTTEEWGCFDADSDCLPTWAAHLGDYNMPQMANAQIAGVFEAGLGDSTGEIDAYMAYAGEGLPAAIDAVSDGLVVQLSDGCLSTAALGEYYATETGQLDAMERCGISSRYFDVEAYGRDLEAELAIVYTDFGTFEVL